MGSRKTVTEKTLAANFRFLPACRFQRILYCISCMSNFEIAERGNASVQSSVVSMSNSADRSSSIS